MLGKYASKEPRNGLDLQRGASVLRWATLLVILAGAFSASAGGCAASGKTTGVGGSTSASTTATGPSATTTATGTTTGMEQCPGATLCGAACTNTAFDPANCGSCGHACMPGELCANSKCSASCNGGTAQCGNLCVDESNDPANCGACGLACQPGEYCSQKMCAGACLGGTTDCNNKCVDTLLDPLNCGGCNKPCNMGEVCSLGSCGVACLGGTSQCGNLCVDEQNDPANCGKCNQACAPGEVCSAGQCALFCSGGTAKCGNKCVDKLNDPTNCGKCGQTCAPGESCVNGTCGFCQPGFTQCNATCVDEQNDPANCGKCNQVCPMPQVCTMGGCAASCPGTQTACGQTCKDTLTDVKNCGMCGKTCAVNDTCQNGQCVTCDSMTTDCDGDGWLVADGDCCDKPGLCGANPELVNPGAIEVVGNGLDDNCNGKVDLFDFEDTVPCDDQLMSNSQTPTDYAKAMGICRTTLEQPAQLKDKTWGLIDAKILRADGSPLQDYQALSIRPGFGTITPATTNGKSVMVISSGSASDATQMMPGPNGGAPGGGNVSNSHMPSSQVDLLSNALAHSMNDWYATANPPLKTANGLPDAPGCPASAENMAQDSVMLYLRMRAPTNAKAFSFNSYFLSAEYPEFVCTNFNDQFIALVDTPNGVPKPIANPIDKNLMTYSNGGSLWPIGINIASGTSLFAVCDVNQIANCGASVNPMSCSLGNAQLMGTGFEQSMGSGCDIGGGTYWLTTAGNVIPGDIVELRIAIWDVGDTAYDSTAIVDGFQWLANATLPGTGN